MCTPIRSLSTWRRRMSKVGRKVSVKSLCARPETMLQRSYCTGSASSKIMEDDSLKQLARRQQQHAAPRPLPQYLAARWERYDRKARQERAFTATCWGAIKGPKMCEQRIHTHYRRHLKIEIRKMNMIFVGLGLLVARCLADTATTANPVATATPGQFLGYRNASNTQSLRDLGFMGRLGISACQW